MTITELVAALEADPYFADHEVKIITVGGTASLCTVSNRNDPVIIPGTTFTN